MRNIAKRTEQIRMAEPSSKPLINYGAGAEARMRQDEGRNAQVRLEAQESEMRLRLMEQERIRQRNQAALLAQQQLKLRDDRSPKRSPYGSPKPPSALVNYPQAAVVPASGKATAPAAAAAKNPFDEEDDSGGYDNAKNPFAADEPVAKKATETGNPFEQEYDSNLDPFAE